MNCLRFHREVQPDAGDELPPRLCAQRESGIRTRRLRSTLRFRRQSLSFALSLTLNPCMKVKNVFQKRQNLVGLLVGKMVRVESEREQNEAEFKAIYTPRASQVFALAEGEALRLNRDFIATEHVLLGLLQFGQGIAVNVLRRMGPDLEQVRLKIEEQVTGAGEKKKHHPMQLTPCVKKVLVRAQDEARSLFHGYVGTETFCWDY